MLLDDTLHHFLLLYTASFIFYKLTEQTEGFKRIEEQQRNISEGE